LFAFVNHFALTVVRKTFTMQSHETTDDNQKLINDAHGKFKILIPIGNGG